MPLIVGKPIVGKPFALPFFLDYSKRACLQATLVFSQ
jgi:hypothetical protein